MVWCFLWIPRNRLKSGWWVPHSKIGKRCGAPSAMHPRMSCISAVRLWQKLSDDSWKMHFFSFLAEKKMPRPRLSILASPKILPQTQPPPQIATQTDYLKQILPDVTFRPQERLAHRDQERGFYRLDENDEFMVKRFAKTEITDCP